MAAIGTAALQGLIGYALIAGLAPSLPARISDSLKLFDVTPPPPPPPEKPVPPKVRAKRPAGAAAPPNLKAKPTEIVAPPPIVLPPPVTPPLVAAPVAGRDADASAGASDRPGPGTGGGGQGNGRGSGDGGDGDGGGVAEPAEWLRGRIRDSDYPRSAADAGAQGMLTARYVVDATGRVTECRVVASSGNRALDETTCRLVRERFRYRPARDAAGRRVPDIVVEDHHWILDGE